VQRLNPDHMRVAGSGYMIAVIYQHHDWGGARVEWLGGAPCTTSYDNTDYSEKALDEENFIFLFATFRGYRRGGAVGWFTAGNDSSTKSTLDTWNDRASSIKWS
jgi:hypothetical protein